MQIFAARLLPLVRDTLRDYALDGESGSAGIAAGREELVLRAQESGFGEAPLRLREHDIGWDEALVAGTIALEE